MTRPASVYRLRDAAGQLLYVGCSYDVDRRVRAHRSFQPWGADIAAVERQDFPNRVEAVDAEYRAMLAERPIHNRSIQRSSCGTRR